VPFDSPRRSALFDPDLLEAHDWGNIIVRVPRLAIAGNLRVTSGLE
jgi:hypothetical protein